MSENAPGDAFTEGQDEFAIATEGDEHQQSAQLTGARPVALAIPPQTEPPKRSTSRRAGRRDRTRTTRKRGRYIQSRPAAGRAEDLAFDATLRAAAPHQVARRKQRREVALAVRPEDYQEKIRVRKTANLILFVVDLSWSMAVTERMQATRDAILSLLTDAYQHRDRVGLVVFQEQDANVVLAPTHSVQLAQKSLADIPVGGKTPLAAGVLLAHHVVQQQLRLYPDVTPLVVLLTDGRANVSISSLPPVEDALEAARSLREDGVRGVVINMERPSADKGHARRLADALGAPCISIGELKAENLYRAVRTQVQAIEAPEAASLVRG